MTIFASISYQLIALLDVDYIVVAIATLIIAFGIRMVALKWKLSLPSFEVNQED